MWKKFTCAEFKDVAKVGMRVRFGESKNEKFVTALGVGGFEAGGSWYFYDYVRPSLEVYIEDQPRTLDELEEGDVLTKNGYERTVLYVQKVKNGNHLVFTGAIDKPDELGLIWTIRELKRSGHKLKQPKAQTPQVREVTMAELNAERESKGKVPVKIKE